MPWTRHAWVAEFLGNYFSSSFPKRLAKYYEQSFMWAVPSFYFKGNILQEETRISKYMKKYNKDARPKDIRK